MEQKATNLLGHMSGGPHWSVPPGILKPSQHDKMTVTVPQGQLCISGQRIHTFQQTFNSLDRFENERFSGPRVLCTLLHILLWLLYSTFVYTSSHICKHKMFIFAMNNYTFKLQFEFKILLHGGSGDAHPLKP